jgi:hypothetical protein
MWISACSSGKGLTFMGHSVTHVCTRYMHMPFGAIMEGTGILHIRSMLAVVSFTK